MLLLVDKKDLGIEIEDMININIIGKKNSKAYKTIHELTDIPIYKKGNKKVDLIINYGVAGEALDSFFASNRSTKNIPMINKFIGRSKFLAIKDAQKEDILVPDTKIELSITDKLYEWIEKPLHSNSGKGIIIARGRKTITGKYYQAIISRVYELRVHAFKWLPVDSWAVQKRLGPKDQIVWNFHRGGRFVTVHNPNDFSIFREALAVSKKILDIRKMSFGAVDFIISQDLKVYFIEINSAPGFSNLSTMLYVNAFNTLKKVKNIKEYI